MWWWKELSKHAVYLPIDEGEKEAREGSSGQIDVESLAAALHEQATGRESSHPIPPDSGRQVGHVEECGERGR